MGTFEDAVQAATQAAGIQAGNLSALVAQAAQLEAGVRAQSGASLTWLTLVDPTSNMLVEGDQSYIPGVKPRDWMITSRKLNLGQKFTATVLGTFKVYAEVQKPARQGDMPKTVGYWHPDDAENVPLVGYFDRPLANGNVLQPVHWIFLYLHGSPDLEGIVISFRSIGNKVYSAIEKLVKSNSTIVPELRFEVGSQGIKAENYNRTYYYPDFTLLPQRNFKYDMEKGIAQVEGGMGPKELETVLTRYADLQKAFNGYLLVSRHKNVADLIPGAPAKAALPAAGEAEASYEDVKF